MTNLDEIWYRRSPYNAVRKLWVPQKPMQGKPRFIYQQKPNFYHTLYIFFSDLDQIRYGSNSVWAISAKMYLVSMIFMKTGVVKATNYLGVYINFCLQLHIYCPLGIKASRGDLHIILLRICKFHENWHRMGLNFYGRTWNYFTHIPCNCVILLK